MNRLAASLSSTLLLAVLSCGSQDTSDDASADFVPKLLGTWRLDRDLLLEDAKKLEATRPDAAKDAINAAAWHLEMTFAAGGVLNVVRTSAGKRFEPTGTWTIVEDHGGSAKLTLTYDQMRKSNTARFLNADTLELTINKDGDRLVLRRIPRGGTVQAPKVADGTVSDSWAAFTSSDCNFRIDFPDVPDHRVQQEGKDHRFGVRDGLREFQVACLKGRDKTVSLTRSVRAILRSLRGHDESLRDLVLGGNRGIEASIEYEQNGVSLIARLRMYRAASDMYLLLALSRASEPQSQPDAERFFSSFALLSDQAPRKSFVAPPQDRLVYQPRFTWDGGETTRQGTGFLAITPKGRTVGVSSSHFIDFDGPPLLKAEWLDIGTNDVLVAFERSLGKPGDAAEHDPIDLRDDYLILTQDQALGDRPVLQLDPRIQPEIDERVWFPNKDYNSELGYELLEGSVIEAYETYSVVLFDKRFQLQSQSGSPIISKETGKVIGTLSRGGEDEDGSFILIAPSKAILDAMAAANSEPLLKDVVGMTREGR